MMTVDRYVEDVMACVFASAEERQRFEADLRTHFADAEAGGQSPAQVIESMGKAEDVAASFNAGRTMEYAGFWKRALAFFGDVGVLGLLATPFVGLAIYLSAPFESNGDLPIAAVIAFVLVATALVGIFTFYFPLLEARFGKTFGKHLMKLRVIRENGAPIGLGQAFVRRLSLYFEMLLLDALFIPFTDKKQRALDIIAKTVVAEEPGEKAPGWAYAVCLLLPLACLCALATLAILCAPSG